jgi:hypothetical protein
MEYVYIFFADTRCNDDNFGESPNLAAIHIASDLIHRIKTMNYMVQDNQFAQIADYNYDIEFLDETDLGNAEQYYNYKNYQTSPKILNNVMLQVTDDTFWWEACIKYTSIEISTECINIYSLLEIETLLTRIVNKDFGCSISSIINDAVGDTNKSEKNFIMFGNDEFTYITGPYEIVNDHIEDIKHIYKEYKNFSIITIDSENVMKVEPCA